MEVLNIEYVPAKCRAKFSIIGSKSWLWRDLHSLLRNEDQEMIHHDANSFSVPWWILLYKLNDIRYILKDYAIKCDISESAMKAIKRSLQNKKSYVSANILDTITEEELNLSLQSVGFKRKLYPYQLKNVLKLVSLPSGASFSVPGAGKTTEALAFFATKLKDRTKLVIVLSLIHI